MTARKNTTARNAAHNAKATVIDNDTPDDDDYDPPPIQPVRSRTGHEWDDDAVCIYCGFDGAEWHHWKHHTYEGKAQPDAKPPLCTRRD